MPRPRNPNKYYFSQETEDAIVAYVASTDIRERDKIFSSKIYQPFCKIAEVVYNKYKIDHIPGEPIDKQMDAVVFMMDKLPMFRQGAGKAFSYFTIVCKNYFIQLSNKSYRENKRVSNFNELPDNFDIPSDDITYQENEDIAVAFNAFADYLEENKHKLSSGLARKGLPIITEVIKMMRNIDSVEEFNRRNLMNNLTTINGLKIDRHYITKVFNKLELHYIAFKKHWYKFQTPMEFHTGELLTDDDKEYIRKNYRANDNKHGIISLSKKYRVDPMIIRDCIYPVT